MQTKVVSGDAVRPFKFLFGEQLQVGIHFKNELYYRIKVVPIACRSALYRQAYGLSDQGADVLLTVGADDCCLWANLRNQKAAAVSIALQAGLSPSRCARPRAVPEALKGHSPVKAGIGSANAGGTDSNRLLVH